MPKGTLFSYRACLEGGVFDGILTCMATLDNAARPHLLLETKTHQFFYCWWENGWKLEEVPLNSMNHPAKFTVDASGQTHFLIIGKTSQHLTYGQGTWTLNELPYLPGGIEIVFFEGRHENDILFYYAVLKQGEKIVYGTTYMGQNNTWNPPRQISLLPPAASVSVWPGREITHLLAWEEKNAALTFSYFQYNACGEEVVKTDLPGLPGPLTSGPVLLAVHGELMLLWSAGGELSLARSFDRGRSWEEPQKSPAFAPAEITAVQTFAGPSNQIIALLKACGLSLEVPLILGVRHLKTLFYPAHPRFPRRLAIDPL
ncbi:MAG: hypothetical protein PWP65_14 [Clostridia bacterium]|nr:hypothetical protein [Clostridia bacterium]